MELPDQRLARLEEPHVAPVMTLIEEMRSRGLSVPNIDPADGGTRARILCLLESPGPIGGCEGQQLLTPDLGTSTRSTSSWLARRPAVTVKLAATARPRRSAMKVVGFVGCEALNDFNCSSNQLERRYSDFL
jgi:hypothetical protein